MARNIAFENVTSNLICSICLELFNDARLLSCHHSFCLGCLKNCRSEGTYGSNQLCPECRDPSVPELSQLNQLPQNKPINSIIRLIRDEGYEVPVQLGDVKYDQPKSVHCHVICSGCGVQPIRGARYKCGVCPDFNLCERCESEPRRDVHEVTHLFIKLKRPIHSDPGRIAVLTYGGAKLGRKMKLQDDTHVNKTCSGCGVSPIKGKRFKCGNCINYDLCSSCEKGSDLIHDQSHSFVVFPHPHSHLLLFKLKILRVLFYNTEE